MILKDLRSLLGLMAAQKSLEGPEDLVGHLAGTKTLDLGSWIYEYIIIPYIQNDML